MTAAWFRSGFWPATQERNCGTLGAISATRSPGRTRPVETQVENCEQAKSSTPVKWNGGKRISVIGLNSVKLDKYNVSASYTLVADSVYCDYDPIKRKAEIGSSFLERE